MNFFLQFIEIDLSLPRMMTKLQIWLTSGMFLYAYGLFKCSYQTETVMHIFAIIYQNSNWYLSVSLVNLSTGNGQWSSRICQNDRGAENQTRAWWYVFKWATLRQTQRERVFGEILIWIIKLLLGTYELYGLFDIF